MHILKQQLLVLHNHSNIESKFPFNWQRVFYWSSAAMLELLANVH